MQKVKTIHTFAIFLVFLMFIPFYAISASDIQVMALFQDKAMVMVNNKQYLLKIGEPSESGVNLIKATSKYAILEVDGKHSKYTLGNRVSSSYAQPKKKKTLIYRNPNGMFNTTGSINGQTVDFLIDTGASSVAISSNLAKRLGLQYRLSGTKTMVETASGVEKAYSMMLDRVKVGEIMLRNVSAIIIEGSEPSTPLLGMSYLGRLNIINEGQVMKLEEKF